MNMREFAALCGVSPSVASRILSYGQKEARASAHTYEKVRKKAAEIGFRPNYAAKILHTNKSNCIGVIIGYPTPTNSLAIINGIADCAYQHGFSVSVVSCGNNPRREQQAFKELLYRGVDAIIWHPVIRRLPTRSTLLEKLLHGVVQKVPVVSINSNDLPEIFKFIPNREEDAARAALRQLHLGCKKFAIVYSRFSYPATLVSKDAYRAALRQHGVAEENIVEFVLHDKNTPPDWARISDADGMWFYYLFMLHALLPQIRQSCDLKRLHIDGQSFVEDYAMARWIYAQHHDGQRFEELFASLRYHLLDGTSIARRATEIAIQAIRDPSLKPFAEPLVWRDEPLEITPLDVLFQHTTPWSTATLLGTSR